MYAFIIIAGFMLGFVEPEHENQPGTNWDRSYRDYETMAIEVVTTGDDFHLAYECPDKILDDVC